MNNETNKPRVCPKTGRVIEAKPKNTWRQWLFPIAGLVSLVWFLIRVIPKPSRVRYPCQQAAAPLASGFVLWLITLTGSSLAFLKGKKFFRQSRWVIAGICILVALIGVLGSVIQMNKPVNAAFTFPDKPNSPVGVAKGIYPGRVTFVRDARAATFNGTGNYWDETNTNQVVIDGMISRSMQTLTGKTTDAEAWDALFRFFNQAKTGQSIGYQAGEKFIIKINNNVDHNGTPIGQLHAPTPQTLYAIVKQLINVVGAKRANITIIDTSRCIGDQIYNKFVNDSNPEIKSVRFVAQNRIKPVGDTSHPLYFSGGGIPNSGVPSDYTQAKYVINCALFRPHDQMGVTLCGKNDFGSTYFPNNGGFTPAPLHNTGWNASYGKYNPIVDLMGSDQLGGKTFLFLIDGIYGAKSNNGNISQYASFGGWPSCIFASQDQVAVDSVATDFLANEPNVSISGSIGAPDEYLHEAAQANNPPSGTVYDPNHTGRLASLGVHEHWNNATDKKYTRNLGTGNGIELVMVNLNQSTPTPTFRRTPTATTTLTPTPTPTRRSIITVTPTTTRRNTLTLTPTQRVTPTPTRQRTLSPTASPSPTVRVTATPTARQTTPTPTTGTGGYAVSYAIQSDWGNGATINVILINNSAAAVNGWTLAFTFPGNQTITNLWNGTYTQSGAIVSVKDGGFNASIPANGGSVNFGFNLNYSGSNAKPTSFTLNGTTCQVQ